MDPRLPGAIGGDLGEDGAEGQGHTVRLGIRLQLLFALGALLVLAFVPLFFAVANLTRATMGGVRASSARAIGRAIAGHVAAARASRSAPELSLLLEAQLGPDGASAIGVYDAAGALVDRAGEPEVAAALPASVEAGAEVLRAARTARGGAILVIVPEQAREAAPRADPASAPEADAARPPQVGSVAVLVPTDPSTVPAAPLVRIVALYTGVVALALLVFAYIAMTRLVVRPVDALSEAARRVAGGARDLEVPRAGARELGELGASLALMTGRLRADEESLRAKIAEVERYAADLKSAQERLVRSERLASVGRLAAGLAHEIGNPIAAILGFQELLLAGGLTPDEEREFVERMKRETERIHKILRDLLDFARPAARGAEQAGEEPSGSVAEAIEDVVSLVAPQRTFRAVELLRDVAPDVPPVPLSHGRLVQVLLNLLLNAADAVPCAGGRVVVRASRGAGGGARIEVEDNGPGIAEAVRETLFEPFITTKEVGEGTGLGLAVCRGLIEVAGGSIGVERGAEGGARFVVLLPGVGPRGG